MRWAACGALTLAWACNAEPPGELVGVYRITGELSENTCGDSALPAPDPMVFSVEIRRLSESEGLWLQGRPPGSTGTLSTQGAFEFRSEGSFDVGSPDHGGSAELLEMDPLTLANLDTFEAFESGAMESAACVLGISEVARGDIHDAGDAGVSGEPALVGENEIAVRTLGGDCAKVLADQGGVFDRLPCRAHYALSGQRE